MFRIRYRFPECPSILAAHAPLLPDVYSRKLRGKDLFLSKNAPEFTARGAKFRKWFFGMVQAKHFLEKRFFKNN
jgi:hypothetical protein